MKSTNLKNLIWLLWVGVTPAFAQKTEATFDIFFKGSKIGVLKAFEEKQGAQLIKDIKTQSDTKVLAFSVHVESEIYAVHENGKLVKGTAYRHANRGSEDVHAHTEKTATGQYQRERNGKKTVIGEAISMCVADLYFREPKGLNRVYSNMHAEFVELKPLGGGKYQLTTPDKKSSYFTYQNGKLMMMEVDTPVGKATTKRA